MVFELDPDDKSFPDPNLAEKEDPYNGLLAVGGDLSVERLLNAYRSGIFPWFSDDSQLLWWSPDPRFVLFPEKLHVSRSLQKTLDQEKFRITFDTAFEQVISECAKEAPGRESTWITDGMRGAYTELHRQGHAHSAEAWAENKLVGGLYGVMVGKIFCGESMFSRMPDSSKTAFVAYAGKLKEQGTVLIDCQVFTKHLAGFGAEMIPRKRYLEYLSNQKME